MDERATREASIYDFARERTESECVGDLLLGLALLFAAVGGLVIGVGVWLHAPAFAFSAAFAFTSALAFAVSAARIGRERPAASADTLPVARPIRTAPQRGPLANAA